MLKPLRHGENMYQGAYVQYNQFSLPYNRITGPTPCYINLADTDNLLKILYKATEAFIINCNKIPYIAIVGKHGNPIGFGIHHEDGDIAVNRALLGNPNANLGGEFISNFCISEKIAPKLLDKKMDIIGIPTPNNKIVNILKERKNTVIFRTSDYMEHDTIKSIDGGLLIQTPDNYILNVDELDWIIKSKTYPIDDLIIAWAIAYGSFHGGNEIAIANHGGLLGCAGGPSTIEAAETVVDRSYGLSHDCTFCANAFFPFEDAPNILSNVCSLGIAPKGGIRFKKVRKVFKDSNVNVGWIPESYRGFSRH